MAEEPTSSVSATGTLADRDDMLDVLFRTHCAALVRLAVVLLGDRAEAEEAVQDAFVSLHRNWSQLRDTSAAGAYLRSAVVRRCRSRQRGLIRARQGMAAESAEALQAIRAAQTDALFRAAPLSVGAAAVTSVAGNVIATPATGWALWSYAALATEAKPGVTSPSSIA